MATKIRAWYANGVLTPLEPLELEEGTEVELELKTASAGERGPQRGNFRVVPNRSALMPGMDDPRKMKQLLEEEDIEHFLRVQEFGRGA